MYAISANPEAVPKRIEFDNGQAEFFIDGANVLLIRNGDEVEVVVHYDPN